MFRWARRPALNCSRGPLNYRNNGTDNYYQIYLYDSFYLPRMLFGVLYDIGNGGCGPRRTAGPQSVVVRDGDVDVLDEELHDVLFCFPEVL